MDILYRRGRATGLEVMADLPGDPSYSTVRTQLRVLERKGHVRHEDQNGKFIYMPAVHRRAARTDRDLCRGPARLCQAFGIDGAHDGADLPTADREVTIVDDGTPPPIVPAVTTRIGLSAGADLPWRWCVPGSPHLSRPA